jgi:glycine oxidase
MEDVIIIGGGVIGLSLAWELAGQGATVAVLEQGQLGQEASWAGAGILPPGNLHKASTPEAMLRGLSCSLWRRWSDELREATGIDNGFRICGGLEVRSNGSSDVLDREIRGWQEEGVEVESLTGAAAIACEPELNSGIACAYRLPQMGQVRNPRHLKALIGACASRGVKLHAGTPVFALERSGERVLSVETSRGAMRAGGVVISAGAWSARLLHASGCGAPVRPIRGQIVLLNSRPGVLRHVVNVGPRYLVPRTDGRILAGSTEEDAGFDKRTTAEAIRELLRFAIELVPALGQAALERTWCGLRPFTGDGLPYLGRVPNTENLFVAAGHYRAGLQLSPATAVVMSQLILDRQPAIPLDGFAVERAPREIPLGAH